MLSAQRGCTSHRKTLWGEEGSGFHMYCRVLGRHFPNPEAKQETRYVSKLPQTGIAEQTLVKQRKKRKKLEKDNLKKKRRILFFGRLGKRKGIFAKMLVGKTAKRYLCSKGKNCEFSLTVSVLFFLIIENHHTLQNKGFSKHKGKTPNSRFVRGFS